MIIFEKNNLLSKEVVDNKTKVDNKVDNKEKDRIIRFIIPRNHQTLKRFLTPFHRLMQHQDVHNTKRGAFLSSPICDRTV